jgi:drug/metabolite transporter (DMT)-like permease
VNKNRKTAYLCAIATAIIWGAAFPVVKPALTYISSQQFLFLRFVVASIIMLPVLVQSLAKNPLTFKEWRTILMLETLSMFALFTVYSGLEQTSAIQASFILNTKPILMTIAGILLLKEVESHQEFLGLTISVIGTGIVLATPFFFNQANTLSAGTNSGIILLLIAICADVTYIINAKKHYGSLKKTQIIAISTLLGVLLFGAFEVYHQSLPAWSTITRPEVLVATLYMGIFGTAIAAILSLKAYSLIEASEVALFEYLNPLIYIPLSVLWLGEKLLPIQLFGIVIVTSGVFIAEMRKRKSKSRLALH